MAIPKYWNHWNLGDKDSVEFNRWRKDRFSVASSSSSSSSVSSPSASISSSPKPILFKEMTGGIGGVVGPKRKLRTSLPRYIITPAPLRKIYSYPLLSSQLKKKKYSITKPYIDLSNFKMFVIKKFRHKVASGYMGWR